jgi:hypothetical protein
MIWSELRDTVYGLNATALFHQVMVVLLRLWKQARARKFGEAFELGGLFGVLAHTLFVRDAVHVLFDCALGVQLG